MGKGTEIRIITPDNGYSRGIATNACRRAHFLISLVCHFYVPPNVRLNIMHPAAFHLPYCFSCHICCFCGLESREHTSGVFFCCRIEYNSAVSRELTKLMKIPVDNYNNLLTVLQLQHYAPLLDTFDYHGRKNLAAYIVTNALDNETLIPTQEQVRNLCSSSLIVKECHLPCCLCTFLFVGGCCR